MLSVTFPSKGIAKSAAKVFAAENGITRIALAVDLETRQYHYTDKPEDLNKNQIIFARMELVKGKWKDKPLLSKGKEARRAASNG